MRILFFCLVTEDREAGLSSCLFSTCAKSHRDRASRGLFGLEPALFFILEGLFYFFFSRIVGNGREKMQTRASTTSLAVESVVGNGPILRNAAGGKALKEWPSKLSRIFCLFIALGASLVVGVICSLHVTGVLSTGSMLSSYVSGAQQRVHRHIMAPDDSQALCHGMEDKELLWRASMVPTRPGMPLKRIRKVAFMFLTVGPLPLAPLWEKFFKGHQDLYNIYIHSLPEYEPNERPSSVFYGRRVLSQVGDSLPSLS